MAVKYKWHEQPERKGFSWINSLITSDSRALSTFLLIFSLVVVTFRTFAAVRTSLLLFCFSVNQQRSLWPSPATYFLFQVSSLYFLFIPPEWSLTCTWSQLQAYFLPAFFGFSQARINWTSSPLHLEWWPVQTHLRFTTEVIKVEKNWPRGTTLNGNLNFQFHPVYIFLLRVKLWLDCLHEKEFFVQSDHWTHGHGGHKVHLNICNYIFGSIANGLVCWRGWPGCKLGVHLARSMMKERKSVFGAKSSGNWIRFRLRLEFTSHEPMCIYLVCVYLLNTWHPSSNTLKVLLWKNCKLVIHQRGRERTLGTIRASGAHFSAKHTKGESAVTQSVVPS